MCVTYVSVRPDQRGLLFTESCSGMGGFQGHKSHFPPLSLSLSLPQPALHTLLLQNCSRTMQKKGCNLQL